MVQTRVLFRVFALMMVFSLSAKGQIPLHNPSSGTVKSNTYSSNSDSGHSSEGRSNSSHAKKHPSSVHSSKFEGRSGPAEPQADPLGGFKIVCLFNNRRYYKSGFTPAMIDPSLCTHINYEFAILDPKTYEMIIGEPDLDIKQNFYQNSIDLKKVNPKLKILISLGGWEDSSKKYSEMANDKNKRKNFIEKAVSFIKAHEFDGMDLAWEYPNCWQGAIGISAKDKGNFVKLLQEVKSEFKKNHLELSISVGGVKREIEAAYDVPKVSAAVDHINVMTYDMHGPWESNTGHHTQFGIMKGDKDPYCNVKGALKVWMDKGADKKKLNMGIALYAKTFTLVDKSNHKLGAPAKGSGNSGPVSKNGGFLLYNEMCQFLNGGNWTEKEEKGIGYYAYSGDQWACYDPPMMIVKKAKYIVEKDIGGALLKDMSGDDFKGTCFSMPFPLTKMCRLEITSKVKRKRLHRG